MMHVCMTLAVTAAMASVVTASETAETMGPRPDGVLRYMEGAIRALSEDKNFQLDEQWRDEQGELRAPDIKPMTTSDVTCNSYYGADVNVNSGTVDNVDYEYYYNTIISPTLCLYMKGSFQTININYNPDENKAASADIPLGDESNGIKCSDCYAYVGATIETSLYCTTTACSMYFSVGGATKFSADLQLDNPNFNGEGTAYIKGVPGAPSNIGDNYDLTLFDYNGLYIKVAYGLDVSFSGSGGATGTARMLAEFETSANYILELEQDGHYNQKYDDDVTIVAPSLTSSLSLEANASVAVTVKPQLYWNIGYDAASLGGIFAELSTPFSSTYTYSETVSAMQSNSLRKSHSRRNFGSNCRSGQQLLAKASFDQFSAYVGSSEYAYDVSTEDAVTLATGDYTNECLTETSSFDPDSSNDSGNSEDDDSLSAGAIAGAVLGSLVGVGLIAVAVAYVYTKNRKLDASKEDTKITEVPTPLKSEI